MKFCCGVLSFVLLLSVAQLSASCCGMTKKSTTQTRGCCGDRSVTTRCDESCVTDEAGNCICDDKCGCNKPNKTQEGEEVLVCQDCEQQVTEEGKCGCNKPNKMCDAQRQVCVGCGEEKTEKGCGCSSSCSCSSCCK